MAKNVKDVEQQKITGNTSDTAKVSAAFDINAEFRSVMHELGLFTEDTGGDITFVGEDPIFPTVHRRRGSPISGASAPAAARTSPWTCARPSTASIPCTSSNPRSMGTPISCRTG